MVKCVNCGKYIPDIELPHHVQFKGEYCTDCFIKELKIAREQFIKDHPCPFKEIIYPHEERTGPFPRTTDRKRPETGCIMVWPGYQRYCIGEENCPIYNGGVK